MIVQVGDHIKISVELIRDLGENPDHSSFTVRVEKIDWIDDADGGYKSIVLGKLMSPKS